MQITDDYKGYLGDGCAERTDCGLTDYGMWAVRTMNEVGMLIDCSQTGHQTSLDTINLSTRPVIFSRSNAKSLCPAKRNISDEQIQAVAAKGGVIGVTAEAELVDASAPNLEGFLAHIDYIARLAGIEHVGLGLGNSPDATAASETPQFSVIAKGLTVKRYSEQAIRKIGGENFVRVFRQAWGD
jgi:membrane dipeptidase